MPQALICSERDLSPELSHTVLWREGVERLRAATPDQARMMALAARPELVLVDRDMPGAAAIIGALRQDESTRRSSIAVVAGGDFESVEVDLLEAGANAVLRLPPGPDWEDRLNRLIAVPVRREARFPVSFTVQALLHPGDTLSATALNVSRSGLLLETRLGALEVGAEVDLRMELPGPDGALEAHGRVVRMAAPGQFGLQFTRIPEATRQRIEAFVEASAA